MVKAPLGLDTTSSSPEATWVPQGKPGMPGLGLGRFIQSWARQCLENSLRPAQPLIDSLANISCFRTLQVWQILGTPREGSAS